MKYKVFVDGQEGTTGLKIHDYLSKREDLDILKIDPAKRKDINARKELLNAADLVFLCLPDGASREAVSLVDNDRTRIIDASTAFRTHGDWVYGLPEMNREQRGWIRNANRVAVPGCHATGFILSLHPLIKEGIVPADYPVTATSLTGYSGGGKKLIERYERADSTQTEPESPKHYALGLTHKHLPEMQQKTGLKHPPIFTPMVSNYFQGMVTSIPLFPRLLHKKVGAYEIRELLASYYQKEAFIKVMPFASEECLEEGFLNVQTCNDTNRVELFVFGHEDQLLVSARFDNLGKGASGAAIQCMNIMLGAEEDTGLRP